jgi:TolB-like protein
MRKQGAAVVITLALAGSVPAASLRAQQPTTVVVLAFQNAGTFGQDEAAAERLRAQLPALFAAELARQSGFRAIDRSAEALGPGGHVDAPTAARVAKQAGARYAVTGDFLDHFGRFRLNAEIVDAASGTIIKVVSNDDRTMQRREDLPRIVRIEAARIAEALR